MASETILERLLVVIGARTDEQSMSNARKRVDNFRQGLKKTARAMGVVGAAGTAAAGVITRSLIGFEQGINRIDAALGKLSSDDAMSMLREQAKKLGRETQFSARDAADAMVELAKKGKTPLEIFEAMPHVLKLAAVGELSMADAANAAMTAVNAFGLEMKDLATVNDQLAAAASGSSTSVRELGYMMGITGSAAASANVPTNTLFAMFGKLRDRGVLAEKASTVLRNTLLRLVNPTKNAAEALEELGITDLDNLREMLLDGKILEVFKMLKKGGMDVGQAARIFEVQAASAAVALADMSGEIQDFDTALVNSAGSADNMQEKLQRGLPFAVLELKSAWEGMMIAIGESGFTEMVTKVVKIFTGLVRAFSNAPPIIKKLVGAFLILSPVLVALAGAAAVASWAIASPWALIAAVVLGAIALIVGGISVLIMYFNEITDFLERNPWVLLIMGLVNPLLLLVGVAMLIIKHFDLVKATVLGVLESIKRGLTVFANTGLGKWLKRQGLDLDFSTQDATAAPETPEEKRTSEARERAEEQAKRDAGKIDYDDLRETGFGNLLKEGGFDFEQAKRKQDAAPSFSGSFSNRFNQLLGGTGGVLGNLVPGQGAPSQNPLGALAGGGALPLAAAGGSTVNAQNTFNVGGITVTSPSADPKQVAEAIPEALRVKAEGLAAAADSNQRL